jgi:hypothetical protein
MTNRITATLLVLAAALGAQEAEPSVLRVYDLGALAVGKRGWFDGENPGSAESDFSLLGSSHQEAAREADWIHEDAWTPADLAVEVVRAFVGDVEGTFKLQPIDGGRRLLGRMTEADHRTVARVLEQLGAAGDPVVEIEVRHLTILDRSLDDATRAMLLAPGRLDADQIAALVRLDIRGGRQGGTLQTPLGRWGVYRDVRQLRYVPDFDVEIAQGASVPDPVPAIATDGLKVAIRPFLLRDGRFVLRVVSSMGDGSEPRRFVMGSQEVQDELRLRNTDFGEVEQCDYRGAAVSTEMVVVPGRDGVMVLGTQAGAEVRWDVLALAVRGAPRPVTGDTFAVTPVGALVADDPPRALAWNGETGELSLVPEERPGARIDTKGILDRLDFYAEQEGEFRVGNDSLSGGCLLFRGSAEGLRKVNDGIVALERELLRGALVEIRLDVAGPGAESRTAGLLAGPMTAGRKTALAAYMRMDTVGDYDTEVAQEARISDPKHVVVTVGVFANADLFLNLDGTYRLHVDLTASAAPEGIRTSASRAGGLPLVQTVPIAKRVASIRVDLAAGRPRTVELGTNPFPGGAGGRLVAVLTVQPQ